MGLDDLLDGGNESGTDTLDNKIKQAELAQKMTSDLANKYGYNNAPRKTVASDGTIHTLSGWAVLPLDSEFERVSTDKVFDKSSKIGHQLRNAGANDQGTPGRYNASHAEKQLSIISDKPIDISLDMCKDCKEYFQKMAMSENKEYITADPTVIRIFNTDGTITEINR